MCKKCAMAKVLALIFNQTKYEKILMLTGTLRAFDFFENMLLHPKFTKMNFGAFDFFENMLLYPEFTNMSNHTQWPSTNIKASIKCINVNCTHAKFLILNCSSSSYVFNSLCISFKSLETNASYLKKKYSRAQNSNAAEKIYFQSQQIHGIKEPM